MGGFSVDLQCPGTVDNKVIIKRDLDLNKGGLTTLWTSGSCPIFVGALDSSDSVLQDFQMAPGDHVTEFLPPPGAALIYAVCSKDCDAGTVTLHYDDPDLVA